MLLDSLWNGLQMVLTIFLNEEISLNAKSLLLFSICIPNPVWQLQPLLWTCFKQETTAVTTCIVFNC